MLAEFAAVPAPVVSSISPTEGPAAGGNSVTITGENFNAGGDAEEVLFGTEAASSFSVESNTEIVAEAPAGTAESTVHVTVVTPSGTSTETAADEYSYEGAAAAASTLEVIAEGSGSGEVSGVGGAETPPGAFEGTPPLECQWNGETEEQTGTCEGSEATVEEVAPGTFLEGVSVHAIPAPGSKFVKWAKSGGLGCLPTTAKYCSIYNAEGSEESWFVLAEFAAVPAPVVELDQPDRRSCGRWQLGDDHRRKLQRRRRRRRSPLRHRSGLELLGRKQHRNRRRSARGHGRIDGPRDRRHPLGDLDRNRSRRIQL